MTQQPDVLLPHIAAGLHAGALDAIEKARAAGTKLIIWRDGKIAEITAEEADVLVKECEKIKQ